MVTPKRKGANYVFRQFTEKETLKAGKYKRRGWKSLVIREMQIKMKRCYSIPNTFATIGLLENPPCLQGWENIWFLHRAGASMTDYSVMLNAHTVYDSGGFPSKKMLRVRSAGWEVYGGTCSDSTVGGGKLMGEAELEHCPSEGLSYDTILQGALELGWPFRAVPPWHNGAEPRTPESFSLNSLEGDSVENNWQPTPQQLGLLWPWRGPPTATTMTLRSRNAATGPFSQRSTPRWSEGTHECWSQH